MAQCVKTSSCKHDDLSQTSIKHSTTAITCEPGIPMAGWETESTASTKLTCQLAWLHSSLQQCGPASSKVGSQNPGHTLTPTSMPGHVYTSILYANTQHAHTVHNTHMIIKYCNILSLYLIFSLNFISNLSILL